MIRLRVCVLLAGLLVVAACRRHEGGGPPPDAAPGAAGAEEPLPMLDSLRGVLRRVGPDASAALVLVTAAGPVALQGADVEALQRLEGVEVVIVGQPTGTADRAAAPGGAAVFNVEWFAVRAVGGIAATDGLLLRRDDGFALRQRDGREVLVTSLPAPLQPLVGARVYVVGPLDRPPLSYGVITAPGAVP